MILRGSFYKELVIKMLETYECSFCLGLVENVDICPDRCERCEMVVCGECGTWLKERDAKPAKFCYGCGKINPKTHALLSRTSGLGCCYMEKSWKRRNLGRECEVHSIAYGWKSLEDRKNGVPRSSWITKGDEHEDVRELTDEEKEFFFKK